MSVLRKSAISIFGSCVSRDVFRVAPSEQFELKTYIARQSVQSAISAPCNLRKEDIKLESDFQKNMVWHDVCKDTFTVLSSDGSNYLMIDLIDERFLLRRKGDSLLTVSSEAKQSGILSKLGGENCSRLIRGDEYFLGEKRVYDDVVIFANRLRTIYQESNIIIHQAYFVKQYIDKIGRLQSFPYNKQQEGEKLNKLLRYMYQALREALPNAAVIDISQKFYASEKHMWGLDSCHYEDSYYVEIMKQMKMLCSRTCAF